MITLPYIFFILNALTALSIVLIKKRCFDFLSVYILVLALYSLPLCFFSVFDPVHKIYHEPVDQVYITMGIAFLGTVPFLFFRNNFQEKLEKSLKYENLPLFIVAIFSLIGFFYVVPVLLSATNKVEALELNTNIIFAIFYEVFPAIGFLMAYKFKNKKFLIFFIFLVVIVLLFGTRRSFAMALIGLMVIGMSSPLRLISKYKYILFGFLALILVILGKNFYGYILFYGLFDGLTEWKNNFTLDYFFEGSEFLSTSAILQAVAESNFKVETLNIFKSLLAIQPIPLEYFNFSSSFFNDSFQPILFPSLNYGMAYNPWAEAYAWLGYLGVFIYSITFPTLLIFFWRYYTKSKISLISILFLALGLTLAFWVQRNSLGSILAYIRNILYPFLLILFMTSLIEQVLVKRK
ncbi:oligosaccharide repeat unit polymerase [Acinetobacter baumannii]|nr:oligosaccharide repeat unit polymerase [Acinetobacter baumannii]